MALRTDTGWNTVSYWSEPAEQAFTDLRTKARRQERLDRIRGTRTDLVPFHQVAERAGSLQESDERTRTIPLSKIIGSVGKEDSFTRSFFPRSDSLRSRWKRAFAVAHFFRGYEPIELCEADGSYYIVDGHYRVSVARALGYHTIQAIVHRWV